MRSGKIIVGVFISTALMLIGPSMIRPAGATGGVAGQQSYDRNKYCNETRQVEWEELLPILQSSVFRLIYKNKEGNDVLLGTATLIDDRGYFVTAAHATFFWNHKQLYVSNEYENPAGAIIKRRYPVATITDDKNHNTTDVVILKVGEKDWNSPPIKPIPLRLGQYSSVEGAYVGYSTSDSQIVLQPFTRRFVSSARGTEHKFDGPVFPGTSGSLLIDKRGRGFALVRSHPEFRDIRIDNLPFENFFKIINERGKFSGYILGANPALFLAIPMSNKISGIFDAINNEGRDLFDWEDYEALVNINSQMSATDTLHFIYDIGVPGSESELILVDVMKYVMQSAFSNCLDELFIAKTFLKLSPGASLIRAPVWSNFGDIRLLSDDELRSLTEYIFSLTRDGAIADIFLKYNAETDLLSTDLTDIEPVHLFSTAHSLKRAVELLDWLLLEISARSKPRDSEERKLYAERYSKLALAYYEYEKSNKEIVRYIRKQLDERINALGEHGKEIRSIIENDIDDIWDYKPAQNLEPNVSSLIDDALSDIGHIQYFVEIAVVAHDDVQVALSESNVYGGSALGYELAGDLARETNDFRIAAALYWRAYDRVSAFAASENSEYKSQLLTKFDFVTPNPNVSISNYTISLLSSEGDDPFLALMARRPPINYGIKDLPK